MVTSILIVGVGGQGTIFASKILTEGLIKRGYDVKMSEIHGMSQRGGPVSSQIRFGEEVQSPVIELGSADLIVSFEKVEAMRWLKYLKNDGKVVLNDYEIGSIPVLAGKIKYTTDIIDEISSKADTIVIDAEQYCVELGNPRAMNMVLLGATIKFLDLEDIDWEEIIKTNTKKEFVEVNIKAFKKGIDLAE
ncbi:MAG TPA: indolepyruvate oxidoreductase subunit beta [Thermoanaerobacterales bacterium]|nr:indolepyruvate oxidoreductase subunit beta [Thermoanaerobacterales bacterium]